jgi:flagellar biogenesis protein FliO
MDIVRQSLAIVFVFALLWTALSFLRKKGWTRSWKAKALPGLLESRGKLALTARHSIHLIRIGDRSLILALHPDGVTFLGDPGRSRLRA